MATLFFSYSHADETLRDELQKHLIMLERSGTIESWHDRRIPAGDNFADSIDENLEKAEVILLLVSPDFLASRYCYEVEMTRALEKHNNGSARVIPVILRPSDWHNSPLKDLLAAPKDGKPVTKWTDLDEAFLNVTQMIRDAIGSSANSAPPVQTISTPTNPVIESHPRSSNLAVKKTFTDADKDQFLDDAFGYISRYFEGSLKELEQRNPEIQTRFDPYASHGFEATIYREGNKISRCVIERSPDQAMGNSITYGTQRSSGNRSSMNESLIIEQTDQSLHLRPMMSHIMRGGFESDSLLTFEGASSLYWDKLMESLQR